MYGLFLTVWHLMCFRHLWNRRICMHLPFLCSLECDQKRDFLQREINIFEILLPPWLNCSWLDQVVCCGTMRENILCIHKITWLPVPCDTRLTLLKAITLVGGHGYDVTQKDWTRKQWDMSEQQRPIRRLRYFEYIFCAWALRSVLFKCAFRVENSVVGYSRKIVC